MRSKKSAQFFVGIALLFFLFLGYRKPANAQGTQDSITISLLTCGPGEELYSNFGHSALRVKDFSSGKDYVFNYGTFDFDTPHFYWKFARGKLLYFLSVEDYPSFLEIYKEENRSVKEQILNFNSREKEEIFDFLKNNYLPENRSYQYDFIYDNCSTRIWDIFEKLYGSSLTTSEDTLHENLSFREAINAYLKNSPWERLGINLLFGTRAEKNMQKNRATFLPDALEQTVGRSQLREKSLVEKTTLLNKDQRTTVAPYPFFKHPLFLFSLLGFFILLLTFVPPNSFTEKILPWVDRCLFFLTGLLGCFILFMWFGTDHGITKNNLNLLWLFPPNLVFSFYFSKISRGVQSYALFIFLLNLFLLVGWFILPQELPLVAIPLIAALAARSLGVLRKQRAPIQVKHR